MGDAAELAFDGGVDFGMIVAVEIRPDGGLGIEVFAAMDIFKDSAYAARDENRLASQPITHLRERMPDVLVIKFGEPMHAKMFGCPPECARH